MKNNYTKKIILSMLFLFNSYLLFSQVSTDMIKYWFYRNRLNNYFVIPGERQGESQIICVRNRINAENDPNSTSNPDNTTDWKNVDYGQHGKYTGLYWGVLATEYYLLLNNGQYDDAAITESELYLALNAYKVYWDTKAEDFWPGWQSNNPNYTDPFNGFFIRGNVTCDFLNPDAPNGVTSTDEKHIDLLNKGLTTDDTWQASTQTFGNLPKGHPGYIDHRTSEACEGDYLNSITPALFNGHPESMSKDEAFGLMLGLALTIKLTEGTSSYYLALEISDKIVNYILNRLQLNGSVPFVLYEPDGSIVYSGNEIDQTYALGAGIMAAGFVMTGNFYGGPDNEQATIWQLAWAGSGSEDNRSMISTLAAIGNSWTNIFGNSTASGIVNNAAKYNWDTFYLLLWEVLHNETRNENKQEELLTKSLDQLNNGPCEGPYSYVKGSVYSGNGWGATYKWNKGNDVQNNGDDYTGNYNGTDYMLLYNLYHIKTKDEAGTPYYVNYVDRNLTGTLPLKATLGNHTFEFGTNDHPAKFIGFNSITSTQVIDTQTWPDITKSPGNVTYKAVDHIELKPGFHAKAGTYFHAYIGDIDCWEATNTKSTEISEYPDNMYTPYFDSLISLPKKPYECKVDDDTNAINNLVTLECPVDTIEFMGIDGDTIDDNYSYYWDFGNGQTSTWKAPKVFYEPGRYNFTLVLTDTTGISDTMNVIVEVPYCPDTSGGQKVSQIQNIFTANNSITNSKVFVFQNPNDNTFQLSCEISENADGTFEIYDLTGRKLLSYPVLSGKNIISIPCSGLNNGIYFYRAIVNNRQIAADKIVVIK